MSKERAYISLVKSRIEKEFNLNSESLTQRDFDYLNKVIFDKSSIDLSTATLRRIWSDQYQNVPQIKSLDALAQVIGYDSWHAFKKDNGINDSSKNDTSGFGIIILIGLLLLSMLSWSTYTFLDFPNHKKVSLTPEKSIQEGVPATIGFNYDISSRANEVIKIQLSWNPSEQTLLDPNFHFYTGTYFYPDYHQAKLLIENEILTSSYIHVVHPGWHGLLMRTGFDLSPIYVDEKDFIKTDRLIISDSLVEKYALEELSELYSVFTLSNVALSKIDGDAFKLNTVLRSLGRFSEYNCWQTDIVIKGDSGAIRVPISNPGCYGLTSLSCGDVLLSGKTNDLSALSTDATQPTSVLIETINQQLIVGVSGNEPIRVNYAKKLGSLKVIKFIFMGYGEVTEFELEVNGNPWKEEIFRPL